MALFENFPYTNFHELNLDWLIKKVEEIDAAFPAGTVGIEKGGTGADNAADARTNLGIFAMNIPTSAMDPTTIESRLQALAADISALDGNIDYRIFRSVTKLGQTAGTATLGSCWAAMSTGDILICPPSDFNPAQVPETAGSVVMVRNGGTSGSLRFYGNRTYEMPFVANYPSGEWRQILNSTDVIPISNGGTGGTTAAEALQNLGIDFSGTVLSVAGVGADPTGNVPLKLSDLVYTSLSTLGLAVGSTINAVWNALPENSLMMINASDISSPPTVNDGSLEIYKGTASIPGYILFHGKESSTLNYAMYLTAAGIPSGTWEVTPKKLVVRQVTTTAENVGGSNAKDFFIPYTDVPTTGQILGIVGAGADGSGSSWAVLFRMNNDIANSRLAISIRNFDTNSHSLSMKADILCIE